MRTRDPVRANPSAASAQHKGLALDRVRHRDDHPPVSLASEALGESGGEALHTWGHCEIDT